MDAKLQVPSTEEKYDSDASYGSSDLPPAYRRDSESSTERSLYDEKDHELFNFHGSSLPTSGSVKEYAYYHPKVMSRGLVVTEVEPNPAGAAIKSPVYYVEISEFAIKKPDIILHSIHTTTGGSTDLEHFASTGESGPVLGVAHLPRLSRHYKVGLGDPSTNGAVPWVDIVNPHVMYHGEYKFAYNGKSYAWKRTRDAAAGVEGGGIRRAVNMNSFQLVDMSTNEVLAVFLENKFKSWKKKGKLRVFKDLDGSSHEPHMKLLMFLSLGAILEKARRRSNARRSAGGGGGGGP